MTRWGRFDEYPGSIPSQLADLEKILSQLIESFTKVDLVVAEWSKDIREGTTTKHSKNGVHSLVTTTGSGLKIENYKQRIDDIFRNEQKFSLDQSIISMKSSKDYKK